MLQLLCFGPGFSTLLMSPPSSDLTADDGQNATNVDAIHTHPKNNATQ